MSGNGRRPVIESAALVKRFGSFTAVDRVDFSVEAGSIFGLLGANGAGKSTLIRMLIGLLTPTSGSARVAGFDIAADPESVKRNVGYMSQRFSLYEDLSVAENINFFGGVYGLSALELKRAEARVLALAGLEKERNRLTGELSGGFKQRLALGCAILHTPRVVFLDEPTGGVDPVSRRLFWEIIYGLAAQGTTVLVTTHYLDEAEYCDSLVLMHSGRVVARGSPTELKRSRLEGTVLETECSEPAAALKTLAGADWLLEATLFGTYLHVRVPDESYGPKVRETLSGAGFSVGRVEAIQPTLEDVFISVIDEKGRGDVPRA